MAVGRLLLCLALFFLFTDSAWVGEDFWTTIYPNGQIEAGRSADDFIHLKIIRADTNIEAFIGFWIQRDPDGERHHESFGHVFLEENRVCGRFLTRDHNDTELVCGAFRVLSRELHNYTSPFFFVSSRIAQPFDSVGYRRIQVARIWVDNERTASIFGGVNLSKRSAYGIFSNGSILNIDYTTNPKAYSEQVEVLHIERGALNLVRKRRKQLRASRRKTKRKRRHHHRRPKTLY